MATKKIPGVRTDKALDELEPLSPHALTRSPPTPSVAKARREPLNRLSAEALLALLHDGRGLKYVLPVAAQLALIDPWADRGLHRGDLLMALLHTPAAARPAGSRLHKALVALAKAAVKSAAKLPKARRQPDLEAEVAQWLKRWEKPFAG